jgi:hypothetical protein
LKRLRRTEVSSLGEVADGSAGGVFMGTTDNPSRTARASRRFTLEEANRMLPLVRAIAEDVARQQAVVRELQERLSRFRKRKASRGGSDSMYRDEVADFERELDSQLEVLRDFVSELEKLGLSSADMDRGSVHFPGWLDQRPVLFCWTPQEDEIGGWHVDDADCSDRQSLFAETSGDDSAPGLDDKV